MPPSPLARLRKVCLALPEAHEVEAWGEPTFRFRNKLFAMYASSDTHHGAGVPSVWLKSTAVNQGFMVGANPKRFFVPPYVGPSGWVGVRLSGRVSWREVAELCRDAYELIVAKQRPARKAGATRATKKARARRATI